MAYHKTGRKKFKLLVEYDVNTGRPTGRTKPNVDTDPDYVEPIDDPTVCASGQIIESPSVQFPSTTETTTSALQRWFYIDNQSEYGPLLFEILQDGVQLVTGIVTTGLHKLVSYTPQNDISDIEVRVRTISGDLIYATTTLKISGEDDDIRVYDSGTSNFSYTGLANNNSLIELIIEGEETTTTQVESESGSNTIWIGDEYTAYCEQDNTLEGRSYTLPIKTKGGVVIRQLPVGVETVSESGFTTMTIINSMDEFTEYWNTKYPELGSITSTDNEDIYIFTPLNESIEPEQAVAALTAYRPTTFQINQPTTFNLRLKGGTAGKLNAAIVWPDASMEDYKSVDASFTKDISTYPTVVTVYHEDTISFIQANSAYIVGIVNQLPISLKTLQVDSNLLASLPDIPYGMESISAKFNSIVAVPILPITVSYLNLKGNQLSSYSVNNILNQLRADFGLGNEMYLQSQTPPAPPFGQGIVDKEYIVASGGIVETDILASESEDNPIKKTIESGDSTTSYINAALIGKTIAFVREGFTQYEPDQYSFDSATGTITPVTEFAVGERLLIYILD